MSAGPPPPETLRANVAVLILNEKMEQLMCLRVDREGWQFVQGGVDEGEDVVLAAQREVFEEIGLVANGFDATQLTSASADPGSKRRRRENTAVAYAPGDPKPYSLELIGVLPRPDDAPPLEYRFPSGTCKKWVARGIVGQRQTCVVMATSDGLRLRHHIDLRGQNGQRREFVDLDWVAHDNVEAICEMVPPCKQAVFAQVSAALSAVVRIAAVDSTAMAELTHEQAFIGKLHAAWVAPPTFVPAWRLDPVRCSSVANVSSELSKVAAGQHR